MKKFFAKKIDDLSFRWMMFRTDIWWTFTGYDAMEFYQAISAFVMKASLISFGLSTGTLLLLTVFENHRLELIASKAFVISIVAIVASIILYFISWSKRQDIENSW